MKLYVVDKNTNQKRYLREIAPNRQTLSRILGSSYFTLDGIGYSVDEVIAEAGTDSTAIGGILGGIIGAIGGAPGVVFGGLLGAAIGKKQEDDDIKAAETFNERGVSAALF